VAAPSARRYALAPVSARYRRQQVWRQRMQFVIATVVMGLALVAAMVAILALGMMLGALLGIDPNAGITR
jgi:hypothetical protein